MLNLNFTPYASPLKIALVQLFPEQNNKPRNLEKYQELSLTKHSRENHGSFIEKSMIISDPRLLKMKTFI
eukprot:snap_masked-scaffold_1-processed-gene-4.32-mRNA-1 protein AED:1.00 eAED:1.00 QI:0/0/0/0/1/1/2/0/69